MKKILLLMIGGLVALAAHADLYLVGEKVAPNWDADPKGGSWNCSTAPKIELKDGYYQFIADGEFQISTVISMNNDQEGWTYFKNNALAVSSWNGSGTIRTATMASSTLNTSAPTDWSGNVYYRIRQDNGTYTIEAARNKTDFENNPVEPTTYTVYFYDQNNVVAANGCYAHVMYKSGSSEKTLVPWGTRSDVNHLTATGKFIRRSGNLYPIYALTFTWEYVPTDILFYNGQSSDTKKYMDNDVKFVNNGYYTNNCKSAETGLVPVQDGDVYLYMHFKEDMIHEAQDGKNGIAYCNILNSSDQFIGGHNRDEAHRMELISDKYMIYRYKLTSQEIAEGTNVEFSFKKKDSNDYSTFRASNSETFNNARWTEFIYATADRQVNNNKLQYAVQTYLSWENFRQEDAKGRPTAYLVGEGAIFHDADHNDGKWWTPVSPKIYNNLDGSCFYIPVEVTNAHENTFFKISWVNVKKFHDGATPGKTSDARDWATYDLGLVGLDQQFVYPQDSFTPEIKDGQDVIPKQSINCTIFGVNSSVKYNNFNQYNWTVDGTKLPEGTYYIVIDTHNECRTVTLTDFDPNPSVEILDPVIKKTTMNLDQAKALHHHSEHLHLASYNRHIPMDKVNTCSGTVKITGSKGLDIENAGYNIDYTVNMNGNQVISYQGKPGSIKLEYLPIGTEDDIEMRAKYTDSERQEKKLDNGTVYRVGRKGTGLTFHSRRGQATVSVPANMGAPAATIEKAYYTRPSIDEPFGIFIEKMSFGCTTNYHVYGDLVMDFDLPDADTSRRMQLIHEGHPLKEAFKNIPCLTGWAPLELSEDNDFSNYTEDNNWSAKIIDSDTNVPVYLSSYTDEMDYHNLKNVTVTGKAMAIYPFLYAPNPVFTVETETPANISSRASDAADVTVETTELPADTDMSKLALSLFSRPASVKYDIKASDVVAGVENVAVDAAEGDAEYYTIAGVRVYGEPEPGIYLRRQGDKVTKVVIR